jgi:hypothetical protein
LQVIAVQQVLVGGCEDAAERSGCLPKEIHLPSMTSLVPAPLQSALHRIESDKWSIFTTAGRSAGIKSVINLY